MSKSTKFKAANSVLGGGMPDPYGWTVGDLPVYKGGGEIISSWKMSIKERLSALFFGRVWIRVAAMKTHPPVAVQVTRSVFK